MATVASYIVDMTWGVYRRQYGAYARGRRINDISLEAEAWFWRINSISADDFGNADGDQSLCHAATVGRRQNVSPEMVGGWLREMAAVKLIRFYEVNADTYLHVADFLIRQPAGRNGKRIRRFPESPWDKVELSKATEFLEKVNADASGGIRVKPDFPNAPDADTENDTDSETDRKPAGAGSAEPAGTPTSPATAPLMIFPCIRGKKTDSEQWPLTVDYVAELTGIFAGVNVPQICREALGWVNSKPQNRKTFDGMKSFLFRWMKREQNSRRGNHNESPEEFGRRNAAAVR